MKKINMLRTLLYTSLGGALLLGCAGTTQLGKNERDNATGGASASEGGSSGATAKPDSGASSSAGSPGECVGLPNAEQVAVTPRSNVNIEALALKFSDATIADQQVYDRLTL